MASDFATEGARVDAAIAAVRDADGAESRMRAESALSQALISPRKNY